MPWTVSEERDGRYVHVFVENDAPGTDWHEASLKIRCNGGPRDERRLAKRLAEILNREDHAQ